MTTRTHRLLGGLAAALASAAFIAVPAPAQAVSTTTVAVERMALVATERGYSGSLPTRVRYQGATAANLDLVLTEPVAGSWRGTQLADTCFFGVRPGLGQRRTIRCGIGRFQPGEIRHVPSAFQVLTKTMPYAMAAAGGEVHVERDQVRISEVVSFTAFFRSTSGSLLMPRPYVQDTATDIVLGTGSSVTLTRQPDGSYLGRLPVTLTWRGDAPHYQVYTRIDHLPAGFLVWGTEPGDGGPCSIGCNAPGDRFMEGETRTWDLLLYAAAGTARGDYGVHTLTPEVLWNSSSLVDVDPADNTPAFTVTVAG